LKKKIIVMIIILVICSFIITTINSSLASQVKQDNSDATKYIANNAFDKWDWRDDGGTDWTTPIRDQIQDVCGSCWAFGALGGLESNYKIWMDNPNIDIDLSEQYILSCSSGSCNGWYLSRTLSWIKHNGIIFEDCMPYQADDSIPCETKCSEWREELFGITDYKKIPRRDIPTIQEALVTYGPLPATMEVYGDFYPNWEGGVYRQNNDDFVFGHVVTIVGFDNTWGNEDEGFWICKNSWGTDWGENGWFRIAYGECSIEDSVYYFENLNYPPNKPSMPMGPSTGNPGIQYSFTTSGYDPDDHNMHFQFDWGDGNTSKWLGPFDSEASIQANYTWKSKGSYMVRVKTRDFIGPEINDYGIESEWSDPLIVEMPKLKRLSSLFNLLIEYVCSNFSISWEKL